MLSISHVNSPAPAAFIPLTQPWNVEPDTHFRAASVRLSWNSSEFLVEARLDDADIHTEATADNQRLWMLGDVFEIFLKPEGREDYAEMHVSPGNHRMHLQIPNPTMKLSPDSEPLPLEEMLVTPVGFKSAVARTPTGWKVEAAVPPKTLGLDAFATGQELRASFCRYDAGPARPPILSTTSAHPVIAFHRPHEWLHLTLAE